MAWDSELRYGVRLGNDGFFRGAISDILNARHSYGYFNHMAPAGITSTTAWPGYTVTQVAAGTLVQASGVGGWLSITGGSNDGEGITCQQDALVYLPAASNDLFFEVQIKVTDADDADWFVGLASTDTNPFSTDPTEVIAFRGDDGDANVDFQVRNGGTGSASDTGTDLSNATAIRLGFAVSGASVVTPFINGSAGTAVTANIPTSVMRVTLAMLNGGTTATNVLDVDYVRVLQLV